MFDAIRFCEDFSHPVGKASDPWVQVECPWCGSASSKGGDKLYGGINTVSEVYSCWRCGSKPLLAFIWQVAKQPAEALAWEYRHGDTSRQSSRIHAATLALPTCTPMVGVHRNYLWGRGFDPDHLAMLYGLKGTGPVCPFATKSQDTPIDLAWRIVIPMRDSYGATVSWQARDITGRSKLRYVGCPDVDSITSYKTMLYGAEMVRGDTVGVVEGVVDQWRMGPGFVATLGIGVTPEQIKHLAGFKRVVMCFDSEPVAQASATKIAANLAAIGVRCDIVDLELGERDPGDLAPDEAEYYRKELGV